MIEAMRSSRFAGISSTLVLFAYLLIFYRLRLLNPSAVSDSAAFFTVTSVLAFGSTSTMRNIEETKSFEDRRWYYVGGFIIVSSIAMILAWAWGVYMPVPVVLGLVAATSLGFLLQFFTSRNLR